MDHIKKIKVTWNVTAPKDASPVDITLKGTGNYTLDGKEHAVENALPVEIIATAGKLSGAFNNIGITDDDNPSPGNLDGGNSFSAQALAKKRINTRCHCNAQWGILQMARCSSWYTG
ncbi:hypothetical protein RWE15_04400 [Virgibacillus halophilus]|uniref:Uncharacterized protein n=1 Tax=Tigheibacillus halophilus TaxID=361280 RepID=A0ABU5C441_9BACI|nr:hypothetical protein [Virgibacillus halophilus]